MKTRAATKRHTQSATPGTAQSRTAHRTGSKVSVTPVAVQTSSAGADAVIPVSVKDKGGSPQAVIPVEVATTGKPLRKRTAIVPIAVHRRTAGLRRRRTQSHSASKREARLGSRSPEKQATASNGYPRPWRTFFQGIIDGAAETEVQAASLAAECSRTAVALMQYLLWPFFGHPAGSKASETGRIERRKKVQARAVEAMPAAA